MRNIGFINRRLIFEIKIIDMFLKRKASDSHAEGLGSSFFALNLLINQVIKDFYE